MRCAILDDYQNAALAMAEWGPVAGELDIEVFADHVSDEDALARRLAGFAVVVIMRERTPFPRTLFAKLPDLKLLVTTGSTNPSIDLAAAADHGVVACGTGSLDHPTAELTWGLIIGLLRCIPLEDANVRAGGVWQRSVGVDLKGKTLGIIGLGKLGAQSARIAHAFGMEVLAWSQNLTARRCLEVGATLASKDTLLGRADVVTVHTNLSRRTIGLIGQREFALMKPTAYLINTSRGPIVDEAALIEALRNRTIAGAALDVFDREPLADDHPLRTLENTVLTPHLGYVSEDNYRVFYGLAVEVIRAWLDGAPIRTLRVEDQLDRTR
ncbi:MAG: D-2-hydroxyacid dehydrogenase family protein [Rhodospirillales bacterium]|jgi:phosphoglycerate dehydrogenase-like enzyme|nr:D-2-hydroxyacid dehydrogenase family protein [Rhodospirillales bacterium]MDP6805662.1 D-2-hydroxyacid dehydrogenase family protein [Rhodospirillales bacterium]